MAVSVTLSHALMVRSLRVSVFPFKVMIRLIKAIDLHSLSAFSNLSRIGHTKPTQKETFW